MDEEEFDDFDNDDDFEDDFENFKDYEPEDMGNLEDKCECGLDLEECVAMDHCPEQK